MTLDSRWKFDNLTSPSTGCDAPLVATAFVFEYLLVAQQAAVSIHENQL